MPVFDNNVLSVGNTPLVKLNRLAPSANIFAKMESRNPANSVKCRIGVSMIVAAEKSGALHKGKEILEPTSGNAGIALAFVAAAKGYKISLVMPERMSLERRTLMKSLGARLILSRGNQGILGAIDLAERMLEKEPKRYIMLQQFNNPANPAIHETTTGPEIWRDMQGQVDVLVAGVGTGGTLTGIARYIKNTQRKDLLSVAVEPAACPVISQTLLGERIQSGVHQIQGIGIAFIAANLDLALVDQVEQVTDEAAMKMAHRLMLEEGILAGISSGAAVRAALNIAQRPDYQGENIVVILADSAERYLSSTLFAHQTEEE